MCNLAKPLYVDLNDLFKALNKSMCPPTVEYYKEVNRILLLAKEKIDLSQYCNLKPDYGELKERLEKLAAGRKRNKKVQTQYIEVKGVVIPATYEIEELEIPPLEIEKSDTSSIVIPKKLEEKIYMPYDEELVEIPIEYLGAVKRKNRNRRRYTYK